MAQSITFTELRNGNKVRQYLRFNDGSNRAQYREVTKDQAGNLAGGWTMSGNLVEDFADNHIRTGWTLVGEPVTIDLTVNEYDDLFRMVNVPKTVRTALYEVREKNDQIENSKKNLDKNLPVSPLLKNTKMFGGVRKYEVPLDFLHKDTFITVTRGHEVIDAWTHMDGHSVSRQYGRVNGSDHFIGNDNPDTYINVRFPGRDYTRVGYPNDGLAVKKGDKAWVSEEDYNRYKRDHAALVERTESARTAVKRGELQKELASARAIIERVEAQLADLS